MNTSNIRGYTFSSYKCYSCGFIIEFNAKLITRADAYKLLCAHYLTQHSVDLRNVDWKTPKRVLEN